MADKMRTTFPIAVTFAEGEAPSSTKLSAIGSQAKSGLAIIERGIGDIWNQSGDSITSDYPLYITNLGRHMGAQRLLNARMVAPDMTGTTSISITQSVVEFHDKTEILLDFPPTAASDSTLATSMTSLGFTTRVATRDLIDSATEWAVDVTNGRVYLGSKLSNATTTVEYGVSSFPGDSPNESWNLIPNQAQDSWNGLKIVQISANKYWLVLPFRRPPTLETGTIPDKRPASSGNSAQIASPSIKRYWGPSSSGYSYTAGVSDSRLYRYSLPEIVLDMFDTPVAGQVIPNGLIHLWNVDTGTIVEGLTFRVPESPITFVGSQVPWVIQVEGATLDSAFSGLTSSDASEAHAHYQSEFALICAGQSVAAEIAWLRDELSGGSRSVGMQKRTAHSDLGGNNPAQQTRFPIATPPSFVEGDDHSQYLSRRGSTSTLSARRDVYNNGMLGDLLMSATNSAGGYQNLIGNSNKIWFNAVTSGVNLYADPFGLISNAGFFGDGNIEATGDLIAGDDLIVAGDFDLTGVHLNGVKFAANDSLTYDDGTNTYSLTADGSTNNSILELGAVNADDDITADNYNLNTTKTGHVNITICPSFWDDSPGPVFSQLSDLATGGAKGPHLTWLEGASFDEPELLWFPIPFLPVGCTVTSVRISGAFNHTSGGADTQWRVTLGNEDSGLVSSTVNSSSLGAADGNVQKSMSFSHSYSGNGLSVVLGLLNTNGGAGIQGEFRFTEIRVTFTYDTVNL